MNDSFWQQQHSTPLFPDILWSKPENKLTAGKLLIIGGNTYGFSAPATAYQEAMQAGIGAVRIIMPMGLQKLVGHLPDTYFAPQNPSGSFSKKALDDMLLHASWCDAVLLAGELGRNSETAVTLETFTKKYSGALTLTKDAVDYFLHHPSIVLQRPNTSIVLSMEQLQKYGVHTKRLTAVTLKMTHQQLALWLHEFTTDYSAFIITLHNAHIFIAVNGNVITSPYTSETKIWRLKTATKAAVYWLQNPTKPLEAFATSVA